MALRQFPAASARSGPLIVTCTSLAASAKVDVETSGPAFGAVPKAGGAPGGNSLEDWGALRQAVAALSSASEERVKNCRRELDKVPPSRNCSVRQIPA